MSVLLWCALSWAQSPEEPPEAPPKPVPMRRYFVSTSAFMLMNLVPSETAPHFAQLNFGVRLTPKDVLIVEAITWRYHAPLGIQYWDPGYGTPASRFPGHVRDVGVGLAYQRFFWRGLYATLHAVPFLQQYFDLEGERIQDGFQLFVAARAGYHFDFFRKRLFVEPSVAFTSWPINTHLPDDFQALEDGRAKVFLFEPGLHVGVSF